MPLPLARAVASSRRKSGSDAPDSAAPDRRPSPAPVVLPAQSSPSAPRQSSVSFSASFPAPSVATERREIQLVNWSEIRGPLQETEDANLGGLTECQSS